MEDKDYDTGMFYYKLERWKEAIEYFETSKHPDAQNKLGIACFKFGMIIYQNPLTYATDNYDYLDCFKKAGYCGNVDAQYALVKIYKQKSDYRNVKKWLQKAAENDHVMARIEIDRKRFTM